MPTPAPQSLQIGEAAGAAPLRPDQKRFNTLIRQIEQARQTLAAWQDQLALFRQAYTTRLVPLQAEYAQVRRAWVEMLDRWLLQPGWSKTEQATLRELLCNQLDELIDTGQPDDAELKAMFDRHAEVDYDTEQQNARLAMKKMMEAVTGLDLGDADGLASDAELFQRMREGLDRQDEAQAEREAAERAAVPPRRRKPGAAQARREAEAQQATQSLREVYRKLASALHPDRETDPAAREAKTALMQQVNQAHAAGDLLALLQLQLRIEQVDASHIAQAGEQRLKHYNKVLAEQLAELKNELARVEAGFRHDFGLRRQGPALQPQKLGQVLDQMARELRTEIVAQRHDLRQMGDRSSIRRWLKHQRRAMAESPWGDY